MEPKKRKRATIWILVSILFASAGYGTIRWVEQSRAQSMLQEYAASLNVHCPRDMEPGMSLKRVVALPRRTLVYNIDSGVLTPELFASDDTFDLARFTQEARQKAIRALHSDKNLAQIQRLGITFVYSYKGSDGTPLMEFTITPEDYR